jgi:hypothetical protein
MSRPDIATIRARADAAQAGPWKPRCDYQDDLQWLCSDKDYADVYAADDKRVAAFSVRRTDVEALSHCADPADKPRVAANIAFIAAARTDVPALCDRIEALEAALREIEPVLDRAVSAACAKSPPDYAETLDALDAVRNALEGE